MTKQQSLLGSLATGLVLSELTENGNYCSFAFLYETLAVVNDRHYICRKCIQACWTHEDTVALINWVHMIFTRQQNKLQRQQLIKSI